MSFTSEVKDELSRVEPTCSHCDRAVFAAIVRIEGTLLFRGPGRYTLEVNTDIPVVARFVIKASHELYQLKTEMTMRRNVLHKTPNWLIEIPEQAGLAEALVDLGVLSDKGLCLGIADHLVKKRCCVASYLRGVFLGSGFVSNPRGDFHMEMTVESQELAEGIVALLEERDISAKIMQRRHSHIIYMKSGESISRFLAFVGAHRCALAMENERVIKSVRNDVNRRVNAEVHNQAKASKAAVDQIMAIRKVVEHYGMDGLPPAIQDFIRLRVRYPDATLKELGQRADPVLSKSAVYHRVRRIEQMAAEI